MRKFFNNIRNVKKSTLIRNSFLLPILLVVAMSISHVISWYDIGNPISWAVYLSIAIEIFALASVSATGIPMKRGSIWALFSLVTIIQIIGNVYFTYLDIDITSKLFTDWVELIQPWFEDWSMIDHKRFLALIQGGTLPFMSLIALHFYIKFNDNLKTVTSENSAPEPRLKTEEKIDNEATIEDTHSDSFLNEPIETDTENIESVPKNVHQVGAQIEKEEKVTPEIWHQVGAEKEKVEDVVEEVVISLPRPEIEKVDAERIVNNLKPLTGEFNISEEVATNIIQNLKDGILYGGKFAKEAKKQEKIQEKNSGQYTGHRKNPQIFPGIN
jgi:hypothetical protein